MRSNPDFRDAATTRAADRSAADALARMRSNPDFRDAATTRAANQSAAAAMARRTSTPDARDASTTRAADRSAADALSRMRSNPDFRDAATTRAADRSAADALGRMRSNPDFRDAATTRAANQSAAAAMARRKIGEGAAENYIIANAKERMKDLEPAAREAFLAQLEKSYPGIRQKIGEGYKVLPPMDREKYQERPGLEGPFSTLSGKVVYYDPKEGSYYDPDSDMYLSYDEFQQLDKDYSGMKDERDIAVKEDSPFKDYRNSLILYDPATMEVKRTYPINHGQRASADAKKMDLIATDGANYMELVKDKNRMSAQKNIPVKEANIGESWSDGISSRTAHVHWSAATKYRRKANDSAAIAKRHEKGSPEHSKHMADYHSTMAKHIKSAYHAGQYGDMATAKKDHKAEMSKAKEYKSSMSEDINEAVAKIACLKCDEVSTAKAWQKNGGFCPKCKVSSQGVAESARPMPSPSAPPGNLPHTAYVRGLNRGETDKKYLDVLRRVQNAATGMDEGLGHIGAIQGMMRKEKSNSGRSAVTLDYSRYMRSHGKKPRDTGDAGLWMFTTMDYGDPSTDDTFEFSGRFVDAKRAAAKWAKSQGADRVYVMEAMSDAEVDAFHRDLDKLVHKHIGHGSHEKSKNERAMTKGEKSKETRLKDKYDDSTMKQSMKDQYGDRWEEVYYATIRKKAMEQFNEMTSAGAIAAVAQPLGKMQRRKKTNEKKKSPAGGPPCWDGKKIHPTQPTKMKGGKRVNNCIDADSSDGK
jgi:hypothetical protein